MSADPPAPRKAVVVAADEEMRILLRGLLQLHRVRVDAEADGVAEGLRLVREHRPTLVVADVHLAEGSAPELVAGCRSASPGVRVILVAPSSRPTPQLVAAAQPDVLLLRPFRIQQFAEAVAVRAPTPPPP